MTRRRTFEAEVEAEMEEAGMTRRRTTEAEMDEAGMTRRRTTEAEMEEAGMTRTRTIEAEMEEAGKTWNELRWLALDRPGSRSFVHALRFTVGIACW